MRCGATALQGATAAGMASACGGARHGALASGAEGVLGRLGRLEEDVALAVAVELAKGRVRVRVRVRTKVEG